MQRLNKILHPTDFSDLAANAFHVAHALARDHGVPLLLLYVRQPQEDVIGEFGMPAPEAEATDGQIQTRLDQLLPKDSTVPTQTLVLTGMPAEEIVRAAKENRCDLIVMGTHGRKGLGRLFHANIADHVVRAAPCPVLALRSSQHEMP